MASNRKLKLQNKFAQPPPIWSAQRELSKEQRASIARGNVVKTMAGLHVKVRRDNSPERKLFNATAEAMLEAAGKDADLLEKRAEASERRKQRKKKKFRRFRAKLYTAMRMPVVMLQRTFVDWTPCFSQPRPGFSFTYCLAIS